MGTIYTEELFSQTSEPPRHFPVQVTFELQPEVMFLEAPLKAEITTCPQCSLSKPTTLSFSQADTQALRSPQQWGVGEEPLPCSSSFEVFNSSFVIYSSAHISSISVLAQQFHSQRFLFSPVAQGLCPAPGWHSFFYLNSEMLMKLNSFSLPSSPPTNSGYGAQ